MRNLAIIMVSLAVLILILRIGMQPLDAEVKPPAAELPEGARVQWTAAGSFGSPAVPSNPEESNPWLKRFDDGGFLEIGGLSAGEDEVFVADTGISRIQVYSRSGDFIRNIGVGMPVREIKPTDVEYYLEDSLVTREIPRFDDIHGPLFRDKYRGIFQAADVAITPEGWYMVDQLRTGDRQGDNRRASLVWFDNDGSVDRFNIDSIIWPGYMAAEGLSVAFSEPDGNALFWCKRAGDGPSEYMVGTPNNATNYHEILRVRESFFGHKRYAAMMSQAQGASTAPGQYSVIAGMDFAFGKLVVCDAGNARVQVYDDSDRDPTRLNSLVRTIPGVKRSGELRFGVPIDIAIDDHDGQIYILDSSRNEVAILDEHFSRIGSFALGDLNTPRAISLSPDGNDIYISDDGDQCVYHYACADQR